MQSIRLLDGCRPEVQDAVADILDTFTGGDGGGSFVKLCTLIRDRGAKGDQGAKDIVSVLLNFQGLIKAARATVV